jgi:hypothetical protein
VIKLSEKIAVQCETEEDRAKVMSKAYSDGYSWQNGAKKEAAEVLRKESPFLGLPWRKDETCLVNMNKDLALKDGYIIIPAAEYLKEEEFKVGDRVECINGTWLTLGSIYTINGVGCDTKFPYIINNYSIPSHHIKLAPKEVATDEDYFEKHQDEICGSCEEAHGCNGSYPDSLCEGRWCEEMVDEHKDANLNEMEETMNINNNVLEVFENSKDAKKVANRFGDQYGTNDRDTLALRRDKKDLLAIIKAEEDEADNNCKSGK